jgi:voltage-gated potassium channel
MSGRRHRPALAHDDRERWPWSWWARKSVRRIAYGVALLLAVVGYGVIGYVAQGWSLLDAVYMVAITISTVGYGEVEPLDTLGERVHTIALIGLGTVAVGYTLASLLAFITEGEIAELLGQQRVRRRIDDMMAHTVVAGLGRMGTLVCQELAAAGVPFVVVERSQERIGEFDRNEWLHVDGDATEESVLLSAGLDRARALVTTLPDDASNVYITLTARQLAPDLIIIARAEQPSTHKKLRQAGANHVVVPASIGAHRIASLLANPTAVEFAELVTQRTQLAIELDEVPVRPGGPLVGQSLRDADIGRRTGVMVIAIKRVDGRLEFPPSGDEVFQAGDAVVLLGRREHLAGFRDAFCPDPVV